MDGTFADGTYTFGGSSPVSVALTGDVYPITAPQLTSGGTWANGVLVVNPTVANTLTYSVFSGFATSGAAGLVVFSITDLGPDNINLQDQAASQSILGLPASPAAPTSYVIPSGLLAVGGLYQVEIDFITASSLNATQISGTGIVGAYGKSTRFYMAALPSGPVAPPALTAQPVNTTGVSGGTATFTASLMTTTGVAYPTALIGVVWFFNGIQLSPAAGAKYQIGADGIDLIVSNLSASDSGSYYAQIVTAGGVVTTHTATLSLVPTLKPLITTQPASITVAAGSSAVLSVAATGGGLNYQWSKNGLAISGATSAQISFPATQVAAASGVYTCTVSNAVGSATSSPASLSVTTTTNPGRLINLSVNAVAGKSQVLTVGFVSGGAGTSGSQNLLIRATGPALAALGVANTLPAPSLTVQIGPGLIASNAGWGSTPANQAAVTAADAATGAFPLSNSSSLDAALVTTLPPGSYTAQVTGTTAASGTTLAEVYDTLPGTYAASAPRLINLSCSSQLLASATVTAGFVIGGTTAKTVLIRATGPALAALGVSSTMPDPQLSLYSGSNLIGTNSAWGGNPLISQADTAVYAFPLTDTNSSDSTILATLPPGAYTAVGSSVSGSPGVMLIEVYEVP